MTGNYQYRVVKGGRYTLNILSRGNLTGSYTFRVVTAKERRIPAAIGERITCRLDIPGRVDLYEIQSTSQVRLTPADGTGCDFQMGFAEDVAPQRAYTPTRNGSAARRQANPVGPWRSHLVSV